jgi:hypothetical protein
MKAEQELLHNCNTLLLSAATLPLNQTSHYLKIASEKWYPNNFSMFTHHSIMGIYVIFSRQDPLKTNKQTKNCRYFFPIQIKLPILAFFFSLSLFFLSHFD